jgi:hypothetical protein
MNVLTREPEPTVLAVNAIERTFSQAVPEGDRLYLRGDRSMVCIGYTGDEGRNYEAQAVAETLLDQVQAVRPKPTPVQRPTPAVGAGKVVPHMMSRHGVPPGQWLFAGPFPMSAAGQGAEQFRGERFLLPDASVEVAGVKRTLLPFDQKHLKAKRFPGADVDPANFTRVMRRRRMVDLGLALRDQPSGVYYLYCAIRSKAMTAPLGNREGNRRTWTRRVRGRVDIESEARKKEDRIFRFELTTPGAKAWIGGVPVANGQRICLAEGDYPLVIELTVKEIPEHGLFLSPCLWTSDDVAAEEQQWLRFVQRFRPRLEAARKAAPGSPTAARVAAIVKDL